MNLLVTGSFAWTNDELVMLHELGNNVIFMKHENDELPCEASWVEGIIGNNIFFSHPIEKFTSLHYIQLTSAGFDRVPMKYIMQHNVEIHSASDVYSVPMAEFAICGVLQLYKKSWYFYENKKVHKWEKHRGLLELFNKSVCIIGCGSVGTECAKRFKAFGCFVVGVDIKLCQSEIYDEVVSINNIDDVLPKADVIILSLPLYDETRGLINSKRFSLMKNGTLIVNIARGPIIDTEALIVALDSHLGGAILDVFEDEPLCNASPLWDMKNVIITPHNSFVSDGIHTRMINTIISNLQMNTKKYYIK